MYNSYNVRKDLNQGIVPIGVPKAYNFDYGAIETARAEVNQGITKINTSINNGLQLVNNTANTGVENINTAKTNALSDINSAKNTATTNINNLGNSIINQIEHGYGYPFVASTVADMTDITKIYVYIGNEEGYINGDWYYYNGSTWVSGGVYNSTAFETDTTLSISGAAADAKVVGDKLNEVNSELATQESLIAYNKGLAETASANTSNRIDVEINRAVTAERTNASAIENLQADVEALSLKLADSVKLKPVPVLSQSDENVDDEENNDIQGDIFLPVADTTLTQGGYPAEAVATRNAIDTVQGNLEAEIARVGQYIFKNQYRDYGLPVIYLYGDANKLVDKSVTLKDSVQIVFPKYDIDTVLSKIKVQGSSSAGYPKKNFTLTFPDTFKAVSRWGKQKKYVIKANWVDFSQSRNVVSANLWGQIRNTRITSPDDIADENNNIIIDSDDNVIKVESNPMLSVGINAGAIDGFPCMLVINNKYWGLYSFTVPKDGWMARMGGGENEAIVSAETHSQPTQFKALAAVDVDGKLTEADFSLEYVTDEDDQQWVATSLNRMIQAVINSTGLNYRSTCQDYIDIDSAVDYYIHNVIINNTDGWDKNYLLDTYDGVKWYFAAYDMDGVLGQLWNGQEFLNPSGFGFEYQARFNRLFHLIYAYDAVELKNRYTELRETVLSEYNFSTLLSNYAVNIAKAAIDYESIRWSGIRGTNTNTISQILNWYRMRCEVLDKEISSL